MISQLRNRLSEFLDHVRAGGRVLVLDRDRPIAEIVPVSRGGTGATDAERLAALERDGIVRVARSRMPRELLESRPRGTSAGVLEALLRAREAGR
jgi:prevent-host-death family protein